MNTPDSPSTTEEEPDSGPADDDTVGETVENLADPTAGVEAPIATDDTDQEITDKLTAQGVRIGIGHTAPAVFWPAVIVVAAVAVLAVVIPSGTGEVLTTIQDWIVENLGWYYMLSIGVFIAFALVMCFSRFGKIRLGKDGERPEFGTLSWFSMLFAAGMGVGLVFYGVGEPLGYITSEVKPGWEDGGDGIAGLAMAQTFIHWGLHPWAVYAVIGLALSYAIHRRGRPVSIRWALEPLLGNRVKGWIGDLIDILAIFGTIFGVAVSLGLGVQQIATGMSAIGIVGTVDNTLLVILIIIISLIATVSVVTGVGKGIKWLSNINLSLAAILVISVLLLGPTIFMFQNFVESLGVYLANFFNMSFDVGAFTGSEGAEWSSAWTLFYWGWWISWAPFVGVFIARISRGRTVREFVAGVLLVPSVVGFIWFSILGGAGMNRQLMSETPLVEEGEAVQVEAALFNLLDPLPLGGLLSVMVIIIVALFFITSSDSGSLVVDMLASGGHPNPPTWSRVLFALVEGVIAIGLLLAGGLGALQAASLATALPFSVILLAMCVATYKALNDEQQKRDQAELEARYRMFSENLASDFDYAFGPQVDTRVDTRIDYRLSRTRGIFDRRRREREEKSIRDEFGRGDDPGSGD